MYKNCSIFLYQRLCKITFVLEDGFLKHEFKITRKQESVRSSASSGFKPWTDAQTSQATKPLPTRAISGLSPLKYVAMLLSKPFQGKDSMNKFSFSFFLFFFHSLDSWYGRVDKRVKNSLGHLFPFCQPWILRVFFLLLFIILTLFGVQPFYSLSESLRQLSKAMRHQKFP